MPFICKGSRLFFFGRGLQKRCILDAWENVLKSENPDALHCVSRFSTGPPWGTRTHGLQNRNLTLYPTGLRAVMLSGDFIPKPKHTGNQQKDKEQQQGVQPRQAGLLYKQEHPRFVKQCRQDCGKQAAARVLCDISADARPARVA